MYSLQWSLEIYSYCSRFVGLRIHALCLQQASTFVHLYTSTCTHPRLIMNKTTRPQVVFQAFRLPEMNCGWKCTNLECHVCSSRRLKYLIPVPVSSSTIVGIAIRV